MNLKDKRVFVSGGAGVIGRALVDFLHKRGAKIFVGDLKPRPKDFPAEIQYRQGDLNYIPKEELDTFAPEVFFHLAATFERSTETYEFWEENFQHNVKLSNHLISCLKDNSSLKRVIFASSYLIYNPEFYFFKTPAKSTYRLTETDPISPRNLCGMAKLMHEMELHFLGHFKSFSTISARIFRVYGKNSRDIISRWVRALLKDEKLTVYKEEGMFDYIFADEVAEGLVRLAESDATGIINLGRDNARRVSEVITVLKKHFPALKYDHADFDIDYEASQANMDYFKSKIGWAPSRNIEDTIPEIIEFEKKIGFSDDKERENFNILISSISQKVPLINAVKKASSKLGNKGKIFGGDVNTECIGKYFTDEFWQMPRLNDLKVEDLITFCNQNSIKAIIPTRDGELEYFAKYKKQLAENSISCMVSSSSVITSCLDKLLFFEELNKNGFPAIKTSLNSSDIDGESFVVKERFGAGSKSLGLKLNKTQALEHAKTLTNPIFQPFVQGQEYSIDAYVTAKKEVKGCIVRTRDIVVDGESQVTTTQNLPDLEKLCSEVATKLELYGHCVFQVIKDTNGNYHIIECNSRFGGASTLSIEAGLDSFYWFLMESQGNDIGTYPFFKSANQKKQIRYKSDYCI